MVLQKFFPFFVLTGCFAFVLNTQADFNDPEIMKQLVAEWLQKQEMNAASPTGLRYDKRYLHTQIPSRSVRGQEQSNANHKVYHEEGLLDAIRNGAFAI